MVQVDHHAYGSEYDKQSSNEQHSSQQQRDSPSLKLAGSRDAKPLDKHLHQVLEQSQNPCHPFRTHFRLKSSSQKRASELHGRTLLRALSGSLEHSLKRNAGVIEVSGRCTA
jgi:hypothetical protein